MDTCVRHFIDYLNRCKNALLTVGGAISWAADLELYRKAG